MQRYALFLNVQRFWRFFCYYAHFFRVFRKNWRIIVLLPTQQGQNSGIDQSALRGDGALHAMARVGSEVGGDGVGGDDAEVGTAAQRGALGPHEVVVDGLEARGVAYLLEGELYAHAYIAVGDAHV